MPPLAAAVRWPRAPRSSAVLAGLPAAVVAVWWVVYQQQDSPRVDEPGVEIPWLVAGPVAAALCARDRAAAVVLAHRAGVGPG